MLATLVGGSLHGTTVDVTDPPETIHRFFRRDGVSWFEFYEPTTADRPGDGDLVLRFSVPPEDREPESALTVSHDIERRVSR